MPLYSLIAAGTCSRVFTKSNGLEATAPSAPVHVPARKRFHAGAGPSFSSCMACRIGPNNPVIVNTSVSRVWANSRRDLGNTYNTYRFGTCFWKPLLPSPRVTRGTAPASPLPLYTLSVTPRLCSYRTRRPVAESKSSRGPWGWCRRRLGTTRARRLFRWK